MNQNTLKLATLYFASWHEALQNILNWLSFVCIKSDSGVKWLNFQNIILLINQNVQKAETSHMTLVCEANPVDFDTHYIKISKCPK